MYTFEDSIEKAEEEFESYGYGFVIKDKEGEVIALCATEEHVVLIRDALNKNNA